MIKKKLVILILAICFLGFVGGEVLHLENKLVSINKMVKRRIKKCKHIVKVQLLSPKDKNNVNFYCPKELEEIPFADDSFVLNVKDIPIRNVYAPYNASIIENGEGYLLFFRYDIVRQMFLNKFSTHIGCVELDSKFNQTEKELRTFDTNSQYSEDPRVLRIEGKLCLVYNDLQEGDFYSRSMHMAELDLDHNIVRNIKNLNLNWRRVEKNWVPFEYIDAGETNLHFEYQISNPRTILKLAASSEPKWVHISNIDPFTIIKSRELSRGPKSKFVTESGQSEQLNWEKTWGPLRGGTPARLIDGEYLAFFHSSFFEKSGRCWYVLGAYTFENKPPFKITKISPYPILFKGIYQAPLLNTAQPGKFVIFPGGFAIEKKEEQTFLHLACGENDSNIKIITIDKDRLLKSLKSVDE